MMNIKEWENYDKHLKQVIDMQREQQIKNLSHFYYFNNGYHYEEEWIQGFSSKLTGIKYDI